MQLQQLKGFISRSYARSVPNRTYWILRDYFVLNIDVQRELIAAQSIMFALDFVP